ncbi:hypothetical protein APS56_03470 [Pseudalgibacter alginicilyticus]|uniref:Uncharacterized protein n=2 Tax=Pseudalgibacter alginicilyticus TaxID=1736674 RepID=A0A0P0CE66_9FLAO|nr:hypothetical protein APS56_03470 [Pseudalgibacter alginicilyticus]
MGIIAANSLGHAFKKKSFGIIGNTIAGVFGSILFIKIFGRMGFDPWSIINNGDFDGFRLAINMLISALGGIFALLFGKMISNKIN